MQHDPTIEHQYRQYINWCTDILILLMYWYTETLILLIYWFTDTLIHWYWFTDALIYWYTDIQIYWYTDVLIYWYTDVLILTYWWMSKVDEGGTGRARYYNFIHFRFTSQSNKEAYKHMQSMFTITTLSTSLMINMWCLLYYNSTMSVWMYVSYVCMHVCIHLCISVRMYSCL